MPRIGRRTRMHAGIEPNLTSLIDVTFLLIVFFVLVSRLTEVEAVELDLPRPASASTVEPDAEDQVAISVKPGEGGAASAYQVGATEYAPDAAGLSRLAVHLVELYRVNPNINLNVRAGRATDFEAVQPLLDAISRGVRMARSEIGSAISPRVNIMVAREDAP